MNLEAREFANNSRQSALKELSVEDERHQSQTNHGSSSDIESLKQESMDSLRCAKQEEAISPRRRPWKPLVTDFSLIIESTYQGSGTPEDPFIVKWLDTDPENPMKYSMRRKCVLTMLVSCMTLCVSLASSAYSGAANLLIAQFQCSEEVYLLGLSFMVLGFAVGPLAWAPLSEIFGRRHVLILCLVFYTLWTGVCAAAQNIQTLIIFRFLAGTTGAACFVIPGGQVADMFEAHQRGVAMAVFSAAPFLGPTLGPLVAGFLSEAAGWRWLMGFLALYAGTLTALGTCFMPETYAPVLLRRRAKILNMTTGKVYKTKMDVDRPVVFKEVAKRSLLLPWALLFREPIVLLLSCYTAVVYGVLYLDFAALPIIFQQQRGWNPGQGGLAFLGIMVGMLIGVATIVIDNKRYTRVHRKTGGFAPPEVRLPAVIFGGILTVIGLAWFAATVSPGVHFIVPILAGIPFGIGFILIFICITNYLVDSYVIFAASVMAANSILRSLFGAIFPLFTTYMYRNLGIHWASAVPGFIALACLPFPIFFLKYGEAIRRKCKYSAEAAKILDSLKSVKEREVEKQGDERA